MTKTQIIKLPENKKKIIKYTSPLRILFLIQSHTMVFHTNDGNYQNFPIGGIVAYMRLKSCNFLTVLTIYTTLKSLVWVF